MVTMENSEEVLQVLERYTRLKQKEIPKELEEYLEYVAKTGDTVFKWSSLKYLFREKLLHVIKNFNEDSPRLEEIPNYPNVDPFNYEAMKSSLLERLDLFNAAPFTIQRLCELLIEPRKQYTRIDKYMRALEKNILVVSTVEPGRKRVESENGDSLDSVVNGDLSLEVNIDIEMENEAFNNAEERSAAGAATASTHRSSNTRPDDDSLEPKAKKVKLMCSGNGIEDKGEVESEDRLSKSDAPDTPAEPDEEDDEQEEEPQRISVKSYEKMSAADADEKETESEKTKKNLRTDADDDKVDKTVEKRDTEKGTKEKAQTEKDEKVEVDEKRAAITESEQIASPSPEREIVDEQGKSEEPLKEDGPAKDPVKAVADEGQKTDEKLKPDNTEKEEEKKEPVKPTNGEKPKSVEAEPEAEPEAGTVGDSKVEPAPAAKSKVDNVDGEKEVAAIAKDVANNVDKVAKEPDVAAKAEIVEEVKDTKTEEKKVEEKDDKEKEDKEKEDKEKEDKEKEDKEKENKEKEDKEKEKEKEEDKEKEKEKEKESAEIKGKEEAKKEEIKEADEQEIPTPTSEAVSTAKATSTVNDVAAAAVAAEPVPIETDEPSVSNHVPAIPAGNVEATAPSADDVVVVIAADTTTPLTPRINVPIPLPGPGQSTDDQPMDEEQQGSPNAVEEVVMAEVSKADESARMEVDDTSQEAMDQ